MIMYTNHISTMVMCFNKETRSTAREVNTNSFCNLLESARPIWGLKLLRVAPVEAYRESKKPHPPTQCSFLWVGKRFHPFISKMIKTWNGLRRKIDFIKKNKPWFRNIFTDEPLVPLGSTQKIGCLHHESTLQPSGKR